jgi:hypothetical protein
MIPSVNQDFEDMVECLLRKKCDFLVVGAHAMAAHGVPRATGDIDILIRPQAENARRFYEAILEFGAPVAQHGITPSDFTKPGTVYQIGLPPRRIDVLTEISGVTYDEASSSALVGNFGSHTVRFIGLKALIQNKQTTGRTKDQADVQLLLELQKLLGE